MAAFQQMAKTISCVAITYVLAKERRDLKVAFSAKTKEGDIKLNVDTSKQRVVGYRSLYVQVGPKLAKALGSRGVPIVEIPEEHSLDLTLLPELVEWCSKNIIPDGMNTDIKILNKLSKIFKVGYHGNLECSDNIKSKVNALIKDPEVNYQTVTTLGIRIEDLNLDSFRSKRDYSRALLVFFSCLSSIIIKALRSLSEYTKIMINPFSKIAMILDLPEHAELFETISPESKSPDLENDKEVDEFIDKIV
jgi:hypothetical protein